MMQSSYNKNCLEGVNNNVHSCLHVPFTEVLFDCRIIYQCKFIFNGSVQLFDTGKHIIVIIKASTNHISCLVGFFSALFVKVRQARQHEYVADENNNENASDCNVWRYTKRILLNSVEGDNFHKQSRKEPNKIWDRTRGVISHMLLGCFYCQHQYILLMFLSFYFIIIFIFALELAIPPQVVA